MQQQEAKGGEKKGTMGAMDAIDTQRTISGHCDTTTKKMIKENSRVPHVYYTVVVSIAA